MSNLFGGATIGYYDQHNRFYNTSRSCIIPDSIVQLAMVNLENCIDAPHYMPSSGGDTDMAKINRTVIINGEKRWIHAETEQQYADKLAKIFGTQNGCSTKHNFREYARNWFNLYSKPNIETATATTYERQLTLHLFPAFGEMAIEDISVDDLQLFFNGMSGAKATKQKARLVLNMIMEAALEDGLIQRNPLKSKRLKITGAASVYTKEYTVDQMRFLVRNLDNVKKPVDQMYLAIQALHTLRLEEVLGLKWEDIDTDNMLIHVCRAVTHPKRNQPEIKATKTESSVRTIGLSKIAAIYLIRGKDTDFVFGGENPYSYQQVKRMCERIQRDTNFDERITPIRFRTTVLTDIYDRTKDVKAAQEAAGHTTAAMTLKHYVKGRACSTLTASAIDHVYSA